MKSTILLLTLPFGSVMGSSSAVFDTDPSCAAYAACTPDADQCFDHTIGCDASTGNILQVYLDGGCTAALACKPCYKASQCGDYDPLWAPPGANVPTVPTLQTTNEPTAPTFMPTKQPIIPSTSRPTTQPRTQTRPPTDLVEEGMNMGEILLYSLCGVFAVIGVGGFMQQQNNIKKLEEEQARSAFMGPKPGAVPYGMPQQQGFPQQQQQGFPQQQQQGFPQQQQQGFPQQMQAPRQQIKSIKPANPGFVEAPRPQLLSVKPNSPPKVNEKTISQKKADLNRSAWEQYERELAHFEADQRAYEQELAEWNRQQAAMEQYRADLAAWEAEQQQFAQQQATWEAQQQQQQQYGYQGY